MKKGPIITTLGLMFTVLGITVLKDSIYLKYSFLVVGVIVTAYGLYKSIKELK